MQKKRLCLSQALYCRLHFLIGKHGYDIIQIGFAFFSCRKWKEKEV